MTTESQPGSNHVRAWAAGIIAALCIAASFLAVTAPKVAAKPFAQSATLPPGIITLPPRITIILTRPTCTRPGPYTTEVTGLPCTPQPCAGYWNNVGAVEFPAYQCVTTTTSTAPPPQPCPPGVLASVPGANLALYQCVTTTTSSSPPPPAPQPPGPQPPGGGGGGGGGGSNKPKDTTTTTTKVISDPGTTTTTVTTIFTVVVKDGTTTTTSTTLPPPVDSTGLTVSNKDFGNVGPGAASAPADITVANLGTLGLRVTKTTTTGPFAVVPGGSCATTPLLNPGKTCTVKVLFKPTGLGPASGELQVEIISADGSKVYKGVLSGGSAAGALAFEPSVLDLGFGALGEPGVGKVAIKNVGSANVTVAAVEIPTLVAPVVTLPVTTKGKVKAKVKVTKKVVVPVNTELIWDTKACVGVVLPPGGVCPVTFSITPKSETKRAFTLRVRGASNESATVALSLTGATPTFTLVPANMDFSRLNGKSSTFTVKNGGKIPITLDAPSLSGPDASKYKIEKTTCTSAAPLPVNGSCTISVKSSVAVGSVNATLSVRLKPALTGKSKLAKSSTLKFVNVPVSSGVITTTTTTAPPTTKPPTTKPKPVTTTTVAVIAVPVQTEPPTTVATTTTIERFSPALRLSPTVGPTGRATTAIGSGFPANTEIVLRWSTSSRSIKVTTDAKGAINLQVLVLNGEPIGGRQLIVEDQPSFSGVRAPYLVQLPTFRPPGDNGRSDQMISRG